MAWNHSETTDENQNKESKILKKPECKRPKCVTFVFWLYIVLGIIVPVCKLDHLCSIYPWTDFASACIVGLLMLDCARMISKRNMTAVLLSALTLFLSGWILGGTMVPAFICIMPMIFLMLPHSISWLKLNNRFSVSALLGSIVMVSVSYRLCFVSSVTHNVISNTNPLSVVVPGDKARGKEFPWQYCWCWLHNRMIGQFYARYNLNGECCYVKLDGSSTPFWGNVIGLCNERFDNRIQWSDAVTAKGRETEEGLPMLCGTVDKKIIMIFPRDKDSVSGTLLVCDSQLDPELDFLFALPDENEAMALLNYFLDNRDRLLSVELDVDDAQRSKLEDICKGLTTLRDQAEMLENLALEIMPPIGRIEDLRVAKMVESFELRRKTMHELACGIWWTANMAVTAIEYNTKALAMRRDERIKYRRQYLEKDSHVPEELLPIDPTDHSGQNKVFDWAAKRFKEGREELYWELHEKTGYSLGRPYNPERGNRGRRQSSAAPVHGAHGEDESSERANMKTRHEDPVVHMYGSKDREKLYTRSFRNGLGTD